MFLHIWDQNYVSVHFGIVYHDTLAGPGLEERLHSDFLARIQGICIWQFKTRFAANSPLGFLEFCCTKHGIRTAHLCAYSQSSKNICFTASPTRNDVEEFFIHST